MTVETEPKRLTIDECAKAIYALARDNGYVVRHLNLRLVTPKGSTVTLEVMPVHLALPGAELTRCGVRVASLSRTRVKHSHPSEAIRMCERCERSWRRENEAARP